MGEKNTFWEDILTVVWVVVVGAGEKKVRLFRVDREGSSESDWGCCLFGKDSAESLSDRESNNPQDGQQVKRRRWQVHLAGWKKLISLYFPI